MDDDDSLEHECRDALEANTRDVEALRFPWYMWGGLLWRFSGGAFTKPSLAHPNGDTNYVVVIKLRRNDAQTEPLMSSESLVGELVGDSELYLGNETAARNYKFSHAPEVGASEIELLENAYGRVGAISFSITECCRVIDAYRFSQTIFNRIAICATIGSFVPLRLDRTVICRVEPHSDAEYTIIATMNYPTVDANIKLNFPQVLTGVYSTYAEGVRSNSPFYAFLCFFSLLESLTTTLQGRLRRLASERRVTIVDLKGELLAKDVRYLGHFLAGTTYSELIDMGRKNRIAIAHFLFESGPRPFNTVAEDQVSFLRDALKLACSDILQKLERNLDMFVSAGVSQRDLLRVFDGTYFEAHGR